MNVHSLAAYLRENRLRHNGGSLLDQALDYGKEKAEDLGRGIAEDATAGVTSYAREQGGDLVGAVVGAGTNYLMDEYVREDKPMDTATFAALLAKQRLPQTAFRGDSLSKMTGRGLTLKQAKGLLASKNTQTKIQAAHAVLETQKQEAAEQKAKAASKKKYWIAGGVVAAALITTGIVIAVNSKSES